MDHEVRNKPLSGMVALASPLLRKIDRAAARRFDVIIANSENVRRRISKCYGRDSEVIFPPVDVGRFQVGGRDDGFYLVVSRLVAYKAIQRAIEACNALGRRLVIVGNGPDRNRLLKMAGPTVEFHGHVPDEEVRDLMQSCTALIFPGEEDFGITPVEAGACGKPVLAYKGGGAIETVIEGETGRFFDNAFTTLVEAMLASEATAWDPRPDPGKRGTLQRGCLPRADESGNCAGTGGEAGAAGEETGAGRGGDSAGGSDLEPATPDGGNSPSNKNCLNRRPFFGQLKC